VSLSVEDLAKRIDHTNLRPYASIDSIMETILEAKRYGFRGVCIPPVYVKKARDMLRGSEVKVITVIGFPLGYVPTKVKVLEAKIAEESGADEIDVVMNISAFKSKNYEFVLDDIRSVVESVSIPVKVIIETSYLTPKEIREASKIVMEGEAFCVKTNTGFGKRGVTVEDVRIIRGVIGTRLKIKASGGIRTLDQALELIKAGADILGTSTGTKIIDELRIMKESG